MVENAQKRSGRSTTSCSRLCPPAVAIVFCEYGNYDSYWLTPRADWTICLAPGLPVGETKRTNVHSNIRENLASSASVKHLLLLKTAEHSQ